jgi:CHAT domain-containing protein/tetratricopeptide (TPR) repeat protein
MGRNVLGNRRTVMLATLRAALAAGVLIWSPAFAGPAEDVEAHAAAIQSALDAGKPVDGETLARDALDFAMRTLGPDTAGVANINRLLGDTLFDQKRYAEAEPFFREALRIRAVALGENHADTARSAGDLAVTLRSLGRFDEAEEFHRRALAIRTAVFGPGHEEVARSWFRLARLFDAKGDYAKAAETMGDAVAVGENAFGAGDPTVAIWAGERAAMLHDARDAGAEQAYRDALLRGEAALQADDLDLATTRLGLANLLRQSGRPGEAEPLNRLALAVREKRLGPTDPALASAHDSLGRTLETLERHGQALPSYERALAIREAAHGAASVPVADVLTRLGAVLMRLDRAPEAEAAFRRELAIREVAEGAEGPGVANAARWVGRAAARLDRDAEAEIFYKRALDISQGRLGDDHVLTAFDMIALGMLYAGQQRFREGEPLLEQALTVVEREGAGTGTIIAARAALAFMLDATGRADEAIALVQRSLDDTVAEKGRRNLSAADLMTTLAQMHLSNRALAPAEALAGEARGIYEELAPDGRALLRTMSVLGGVQLAAGDAEDAAKIYDEVLARLVARHGEDSAEIQPALSDLARASFALGDFAKAAANLERAVAMVERLAAVDAATAFTNRTGEIEDVAVARASVFDHLVKTYHRLAGGEGAGGDALAEKAFVTAQRVIESQAAAALNQLAARQATGDGALAALVRERQDLVVAWREADRKLTAARADGNPDAGRLETLGANLAVINARIAAIDGSLVSDFPDFASLQRPAMLSFADVQAHLGEDEVLLFYADTGPLGDSGFETYLWAVAKTGAPRWVKLALPTDRLSATVRSLRETMGVGPVTRGVASLKSQSGTDRTGEILEAAHTLYEATLAPVADMIDGKDLIVVPSKKLANLPFHLMVSAPTVVGASDRYREAAWLVRDHAITVLPAVASLAATTEPAAADTKSEREPYLGFANPLLTGRNGDNQRAFEHQGCMVTADPTPIAAADPTELPPLDSLFRNGAANVAAVRALEPLPETADEACAIAAALGAGSDSLRLGTHATEAEVKALSDSARLAQADIIHFATHGLVSGELNGLAEPAIVLTPPETAGPLDDGLLTASEVATLKLDAVWVILSACNTASGDGGGEALSGLARAFFYAGAKSLMVSHWPVNSVAAVALATGAVSSLADGSARSRAEALQLAMLAEIDKGGFHADPTNWAPFVVVGR